MAKNDQEWRHVGNKVSSEYMQKVDEFITFACGKNEVVIDGLMKCPCAKLETLRATPEFQKKSQRAKANKKSFQKAGTLHCQGSISTEYLREKLTKKYNRPSSAAEVFKESHETKKEKFIDVRSELTWAEYKRLRAEAVISDSETQEFLDPIEDDDLFYKAAGGYDNKGRVYGLGSAADSYYNKPSSGSASKRSKSGNKEMQDEIEQLK